MKNCGGCGTNNEPNAVYCLNCGTALSEQTSIVDKQQAIKTALPQERNYMIWGVILLVVSIIGNAFNPLIFDFNSIFFSFGGFLLSLPYVYYIYLNFKDFEKLQLSVHGMRSQNSLLMAILYLFFPIIPRYIKYNMLVKHLQVDHNEKILPPNAVMVILLVDGLSFILSFFGVIIGFGYSFTFVIIIQIGITILLVYFENTWQGLFNTHIRNHSNALQ